MSDWTHKNGPVTVTINRDAMGFVLDRFAPELNSLAEEVAEGARQTLPKTSMRRFIAVKRAGTISGNNVGRWRLRLRGRRYGSGTGERLMRGVEVPVALVTNNSNLAQTWEYGGIPKPSVIYRRKGSRKIAVARTAGGAEYDETYFRQYGPLLNGARKASRGRLVQRYRRSR